MGAVELAWKLADSDHEYLLTLERHRVYVALGSGDTDRAIIDLISVAARERIMLPRMVIAGLQLWHTAYDDLDAHLGRSSRRYPSRPSNLPQQQTRRSPICRPPGAIGVPSPTGPPTVQHERSPASRADPRPPTRAQTVPNAGAPQYNIYLR
ncbi:MAG TPA: hypothetical protein VG327_03835 [Mycobacterium sp.]|nr:hypothetical protein [Mycobacterium sp.]